MSCVLITGSEGNIGRFLCAQVRAQRPDWRLVRITHTPITTPSNRTNEMIYQVDLNLPESLRSIISKERVTHIIHAAARGYHADSLKQDPYGVLRDDVGMFFHTLQTSNQSSVKKVVYLSSATVYESATELPFTEDMTQTSPPPVSPIGLSKLLCERALQIHAQQHKQDFTIWRLFNIVSPLEPHTKLGAHVYVDFYRQLFIDHVTMLPIFGNGQQVRCFTWVDDIAQAIIQFLDDSRTSGQVFNLGGNEPKTLIELKDLLLSIGKRYSLFPLSYQPAVEVGKIFFGTEAPRRIPSIEKALTLLGWRPSTSFEECFEKFILDKQSYDHP